MQITAYIIDDEPGAVEQLQSYISRIPFLNLVGSNTNPVVAADEIGRLKPQILFCDIDMPAVSGLTLLSNINQINNWGCYLVIVSGHRDYGIDGYDLNVRDFLLKPYTFEDFWKKMNKASGLIKPEESIAPYAHANPALNEKLVIYALPDGITPVPVLLHEIDYIESIQNHVTVHYANARVTTRRTLKSMLGALPAGYFIQVHQSFIVARHKIKHYTADTIILSGGQQLKIGTSYRDPFFKLMQQQQQYLI
jgi:DNA-binding LytR/AlgR family response regulator